MAARPPTEADGRYTIVCLADVPRQHRLLVANRVIRAEGLVGIPALDMLLAAEEPRENPWLVVPADVARRICGAD